MAKWGEFKWGEAKWGTGGGTQPPAGISFTNTGGGNHGGEDWILDEDVAIAGVHINIGRFEVADGVIATVQDYDGASYGELEIQAKEIAIDGALIGSGRAYRGGASD